MNTLQPLANRRVDVAGGQNIRDMPARKVHQLSSSFSLRCGSPLPLAMVVAP